ncbi:MAG: Rid family detoxifying hydrolase [Candidatus Limnocylindrales bacterium]
MEPEIISGPGMPKALGPYSHVVRLGDTLYVSGQPGIDPATGQPPSGFVAEARQAFTNLKTVLEAAGSSMDRVAKVTVFLTDANNFGQLNELFGEFFAARPPARSTPIVGLPRGLLISIDAIAGTQS